MEACKWLNSGVEYIPMLLPDAVIPIAMETLVVKYVGRIATLGTKRHPAPRPTRKAWANSAW